MHVQKDVFLYGITTKEVINGGIRFQLSLTVYIVCMYIETKHGDIKKMKTDLLIIM